MLKKILIITGGVLILLIAAVVFLPRIRDSVVIANVEQEWQTARVEKIRNLGTTHKFEILPLFEQAAARPDLEADHGVSYLIKTDHQNILLDVGMTPARLSHNMQALGISTQDFSSVVITHHHPDHVGGNNAWQTYALTAGDPSLDLRGKQVYVPVPLTVAGVEPVVAAQPTKIADGIATIGTISFLDPFPDSFIYPRNVEQAVAVNVAGKGIVLITGCGHQTVEKIVARAQALFEEPVVGLVGGLHYQGFTRAQALPHIEFVKSLNLRMVGLSPHDSSKEAMDAFRQAFPNAYQEVQVGRTISFDNGQAHK